MATGQYSLLRTEIGYMFENDDKFKVVQGKGDKIYFLGENRNDLDTTKICFSNRHYKSQQPFDFSGWGY